MVLTRPNRHEEDNPMVRVLEKPMAVSIPELARMTGLSEALLYQKANEDILPGCRRLGKRFLVHVETFEEWLRTGQGLSREDKENAPSAGPGQRKWSRRIERHENCTSKNLSPSNKSGLLKLWESL
jgi:predicted DNA-binding transcriptional regulator AlpA